MAEYRRPSESEIKKMNKDQLKDALQDVFTELDKVDPIPEEGDMNDKQMLRTILTEVRAGNQKYNELREEVDHLKKDNTTLATIVVNQQRFLESLDGEKRARNLIVTGLNESGSLEYEGESADNDDDKINLLFQQLDIEGGVHTVQIMSVERLGKAPEASADPTVRPRNRPIKVTVASSLQKKKVLSKAKSLKEKGPVFSKVYIKQDLHPAVRKENDRMRRSEKSEREKPENAGKAVVYDKTMRQITVNGNVVDRYSPTFF